MLLKNVLSRMVYRSAPSGRRQRIHRNARSFQPRIEILEDRTVPTTWTVTSPADGGDGSLRTAIAAAQSGDQIVFDPSVHGQTIRLTSGELALTKSLDIEGLGAGQLAISGNHASRVFYISAGVTVTIAGLTITNGYYFGGIYNEGTFTLNNSTVSDNVGVGFGGGISNGGMLTLNNATVSGNSAIGDIDGGGILNGGTVTLNNSTVSGNNDFGIENYGTVTLNNSTVSGNDFGVHGGATVSNSTVAGNLYGIFGGLVNARNSIIARNTYRDLYGNLTSLGHNLIGNTQDISGFDPTDLLNVDPMLGPLQDNGGPTFTRALLAGSPALNAGDPTQLGAPDQRGAVRSRGVNIGAYQASAHVLVLTGLPNSATAGTALGVTVTAKDVFGQTAFGYTGTVHFTSTDNRATLPGDYPFAAGDNGSHTFTDGVTLVTAGSQAVTATDTASSSVTGAGTVAVSPAAADHIVVSGPDSASAGVHFDLVVTIQDQYGNTVTGYTGTVTFATDDSDGTLPDDYTFTADDAGSHVFSGGVTLYADGSRITVSDTVVDTLTGSVVITLE
jgi:hypothetical protein